MLRTVLLAWPLLAGYDSMLEAHGSQYRRFAFLSFDVLLSHSGHAYVEEVNTNGFLMGTRIPQGWQYTLDAMRLLGIGGFPRRPEYQSRAANQLGARFPYCSQICIFFSVHSRGVKYPSPWMEYERYDYARVDRDTRHATT